MLIINPEKENRHGLQPGDKGYEKLVKSWINEDCLLYFYALYLAGVPILSKWIIKLERDGYINQDNRKQKGHALKNAYSVDYTHQSDVDIKVKREKQIKDASVDASIYAIENTITDDELLELTNKLNWESGYDQLRPADIIRKSHWDLEDMFMDYDNEFYYWINSINKGFQNYHSIDKWQRFELYKKQAHDWLFRDKISFDPTAPQDAQVDWIRLEKSRCIENSLYRCNKYLWLKDGTEESGKLQFNAWEVQSIVLYLYDCYLSFIIGKLRQIGFTSVIAGASATRTIMRKNYHTKLVAQRGKKSQEIFKDKVKFPIAEMPRYLRPTINSTREDWLEFGYVAEKGGASSSGSKFEISAPHDDVVNAGTPNEVLLDEIGLMRNVSEIIGNGRPTMYKYIHAENKMKIVRQLIAWGTGGIHTEGGSEFQSEWNAAKMAWMDKDFSHALIPLFINAYAKPGFNDKFYEQEKKAAYRKKKLPNKPDPKAEFHYTYPIIEDDMFLTGSETLIPTMDIVNHLNRINKLKGLGKIREVKGYFEPIYDTSSPLGEYSDVPYKVIGAKFIYAPDNILHEENNDLSCVTIYSFPDHKWLNRYWQGIDPIAAQTGSSKFSSAIWDKEMSCPAAILNSRPTDPNWAFLQSLCLNLFYSRKAIGVKALIEENIGQNCIEYYKKHGKFSLLIPNRMLPQDLQQASIDIGFYKSSKNAKYIIYRGQELLLTYGAYINSEIFWLQVKTLVKKLTRSGNETYEPENKNFHNDDVYDSVLYSFMASRCYNHQECRRYGSEDSAARTKKRYRYINGSLVLANVRV